MWRSRRWWDGGRGAGGRGYGVRLWHGDLCCSRLPSVARALCKVVIMSNKERKDPSGTNRYRGCGCRLIVWVNDVC